MEVIFHEKQEGSLCAQHCLNALLQGSYFTPVDLGTLAQRMDDEERIRMAENGIDSAEYQRFLSQPSENMDDSGYFSVQVISSALEVWGLELVPYTSTEERAREACRCPSAMQAYICHYRDHWFTIRRLGNQWFNLNSLLSAPELISDTYLVMFLAQLQQEGYSIFVVFGELPDCDADKILKIQPVQRNKKSEGVEDDLQLAIMRSMESKPQQSSSGKSLDDEEALQQALALSLQSSDSSDEEKQLEKAINMSLECRTPSKPSTPSADADEVRQRRMAFLNQLTSKKES